MLLRVISRQLRPSVLCHRVNYHSSLVVNRLHRCPALWTFQSMRTLKTDATDDKGLKTAKIEKDVLLQQNDPDVFGTFSEVRPFTQTEFEDEGDIAESEYLTNIPFRSQKLRTHQYADMIKNHFKFKRVKEAIDVLEVRMLKEDQVKPSSYIYNLVISECGRLGYAQKAFQLYTRMKQRDLKVTGATYTALFNACANSPYPKDALDKANNLRKIMLQNGYVPNESNYNAMIKAFGRCNDIETAFLLVDEMKGHKLQLKTDTFNFLLQACISEKEFGFRHALLVWHKMRHKGLTPDLYTFNLMLKCVEECSIGDLETMRGVIGQIMSESAKRGDGVKLKVRGGDRQLVEIIPKNRSTNANEGGTSDSGGELVTTTDATTGEDQIEPVAPANTNDDGRAPNLISKTPHLGSLVALKTVTKPEDRLLLLGGISGFLDEMTEAGVQPDIRTFTKLLDVIPSTTAAEHKLIQIVRKAGVPTDVDFFNMLIKKRSMRFDFKGAKEVLTMISLSKLRPDIVTYGVMALGCRTMDDARDYLQELHDAGVKVNMPIIGAMMHHAVHLKNYDYVLEVLHICKMNGLKPSPRFLEYVYKFNKQAFRNSIHKKGSKHDRNEFFRFSREFRKWLKDMDLPDLNMDEALKSAKEHPWKQFKEAQPDGLEPAKNTRIQSRKKRRNSIGKLTMTRIEKGGKYTPPPESKKKPKKEDQKATLESTSDSIEDIVLNDK